MKRTFSERYLMPYLKTSASSLFLGKGELWEKVSTGVPKDKALIKYFFLGLSFEIMVDISEMYSDKNFTEMFRYPVKLDELDEFIENANNYLQNSKFSFEKDEERGGLILPFDSLETEISILIETENYRFRFSYGKGRNEYYNAFVVNENSIGFA